MGPFEHRAVEGFFANSSASLAPEAPSRSPTRPGGHLHPPRGHLQIRHRHAISATDHASRGLKRWLIASGLRHRAHRKSIKVRTYTLDLFMEFTLPSVARSRWKSTTTSWRSRRLEKIKRLRPSSGLGPCRHRAGRKPALCRVEGRRLQCERSHSCRQQAAPPRSPVITQPSWYGLRSRKHIEDYPNNSLVLHRQTADFADRARQTSISSTRDEPGHYSGCCVRSPRTRLTSPRSNPGLLRNAPGNSFFFIDLDGHMEDLVIATRCCKMMEKECSFSKFWVLPARSEQGEEPWPAPWRRGEDEPPPAEEGR